MKRHAFTSFLTGAAAGLLGGLVGVGGGVILVPMLVGIFRLGQHQAHGTSLAIMIPLALSAAILYALQGYLEWPLALEVALGSTVGAVLGAKLMNRMAERPLRICFGLLLVGVAVRLFLWPGK